MLKFIKIVYHSYKRRLQRIFFPMESKMSQNIKQIAIKNNISIFIETGTYFGDTTYAIKDGFKEIYSIELSIDLANFAKKSLCKYPHIKIIQGDSAQVIENLMKNINERVLFWLDGHYSAGVTARSNIDSPIIQELQTIVNHKNKNHIILIDDAHLFNGSDGYPTMEELENIIRPLKYKTIEVKNNIIYIEAS